MDWRGIYTAVPRTETSVAETFVRSIWTMTGPSRRPIYCELWHVSTGSEVRVTRNGDLLRSQLCRGPAADENAVTYADAWATELRAAGFTDLATADGDL